MPLDSLTLSALANEISRYLLNSRITKIHQPDKYTITLKFHGANGNHRLLISAHPVFARVHLTEEDLANPATAPMFCMVLRKHLDNARLTNVQQVNNDRILHLDFLSTDEIGNSVNRRLTLEIMGKHSNLILTNPEDGLIFDGIRRYSHNLSRHREILPGRIYISPPEVDKLQADGISLEDLQRIFLDNPSNIPPMKLLSQNIMGFSPFLAKEIIVRAGLDSQTESEFWGEYEYSRILQAINEINTVKFSQTYQPILLKTNQEYCDFYPIKLHSFDATNQREFPTMSQAIDYYYKISKEQSSFNSQQSELSKLITKEEQRLKKKIALQQVDLDSAVNAEKYKEAGDILTTYMYLIQKGMAEIYLDNFEQPSKNVKITLIPHLSPIDNIKRYYHKFNKAKNAQQLISQQLNANLEELEYVESITLEIEEATDIAELLSIKDELMESGYLKVKKNPKGKPIKANKKPLEEPLVYQSSDGYTILVGKNNKQNDVLTLKIAAKDDIWLHTQKIPGSHVIIKKQQGEISQTAIEEAAAIAGWHSKARYSSQVPVDYTVVSQVKKPNGAKPGMVIYFQQKTVYVNPAQPN